MNMDLCCRHTQYLKAEVDNSKQNVIQMLSRQDLPEKCQLQSKKQPCPNIFLEL